MIEENCIAPKEIQEGDLLAYIEGAASGPVSRHIARCSACAAEVEALRLTDSLFRHVLSGANDTVFDGNYYTDRSVSESRAGQNRSAWLQHPIFKRPFRQPVTVAIGLILIVVLSLPVLFYGLNRYLSPTDIVKRKVATVAVTVAETGEVIKEVATKVTQTIPMEEADAAAGQIDANRVMVEELIEIIPPRNLRERIEMEFEGEQQTLSVYSPAGIDSNKKDRLVTENGGTTYVVWTGNQDGKTALYFVSSTDGGQTWGDSRKIQDGFEQVFTPNLAIDTENDNLYVLWRSGNNPKANIYLARSADRGATWSRSIHVDEAIGQVLKPSLAVGGGDKLYVTWQNRDRANISIYFIHSTDGGETWSDKVRLAKIGG
jgi:anti-sigma factor RsiW